MEGDDEEELATRGARDMGRLLARMITDERGDGWRSEKQKQQQPQIFTFCLRAGPLPVLGWLDPGNMTCVESEPRYYTPATTLCKTLLPTTFTPAFFTLVATDVFRIA
ncbi:hypothetical protein Pmani_036947 [Petrolisthes manimaculis]|uniref:Uncharacterized protein n=1 Tax=Petrolisthes manimaculis TaxID=1843537 RepID=A0AAE1NJ66_9EUCA|nr:hypothetical protein Pmani_036947 [Petrolisthes manimaculis]